MTGNNETVQGEHATLEATYSQFVLDSEWQIIRDEEKRVAALEQKAVIAATVVVSFAAFALGRPQKQWTWVQWTLALGVLYCVVCLMISTYFALRARKYAAIDPKQFVKDSLYSRPPSERRKPISRHLCLVAMQFRQDGERLGEWVAKTQEWALVAIVLILVYLATTA